MFSCIIIDDEVHSLSALQDYLSNLPDIQIVGSYLNPLEALNAIQQSEMLDLILLDINMPELSGVDLARLIRNKTRKLVFTTGHAKYAYDAFAVRADAYLLKPYTLAKFLETIQQLELQQPMSEEFFFVKGHKDENKIVKLHYRDITVIESNLNYVKISTGEKQVITYMSLTEMGKILAKQRGFMQVHRSFIVRPDQIKNIVGNTLEMNDGQKVTLGKQYQKKFQEYLSSKTLKAGISTYQS